MEELLRVSREINANPKSVAEERKKLGLLKDLPAKLEADITPYFEEAVKNAIIPNDGGAAQSAQNRPGLLHAGRPAQGGEPEGRGLLGPGAAQGGHLEARQVIRGSSL